MASPRSPEWYRNTYRDLSTSGTVLAAGTGEAPVVTTPDAKHTIFIQKITTSITTSAAQTITYRDTSGTPIPVTIIEASAAVGTIRTIDFGARGFALGEGKNLDVVNVAGPAYGYVIECYARQTGVGQDTTIARTI